MKQLFDSADWLPTLAGALHFIQLPSMVLARRILGWDREFARLSPINRGIVAAIGGGILVCVVGLGLLVASSHGRLLDSPVGVGLCVFLSVFWAYRGAVQLFVYGSIWPADSRAVHHALSVLFVVLTVAYAGAALLGGAAT